MATITHVMSIDLVPADALAAVTLRQAIDERRRHDGLLDVSTGPVNEIVLHGVSELHLEMAVYYLQCLGGLNFKVGASQVRYMERITIPVERDYTHKKLAGGAGAYAKVKIRFEPGEPGSGFVFHNAAPEDAVPARFARGVEQGLGAAKDKGVAADLPVIDLTCTLLDGGYHPTDSSESSFEEAARACFREAMPKAGPRLLEPIMYVAVLTPEDYIGDVVRELNSRRGIVKSMETRGEMQEIAALVPFANLFGYQHALRSMTRGGAQYMMTFDHYETVPLLRGPDDDTFPPAVGMRA